MATAADTTNGVKNTEHVRRAKTQVGDAAWKHKGEIANVHMWRTRWEEGLDPWESDFPPPEDDQVNTRRIPQVTTGRPVIYSKETAKSLTRIDEVHGEEYSRLAPALSLNTPSGLPGAPSHLELRIAAIESGVTRIFDKSDEMQKSKVTEGSHKEKSKSVGSHGIYDLRGLTPKNNTKGTKMS